MSYLGPRVLNPDSPQDGWLTLDGRHKRAEIGAAVEAIAGPGSRLYIEKDGEEFVYNVVDTHEGGTVLGVAAGGMNQIIDIDINEELLGGAILTISPYRSAS